MTTENKDPFELDIKRLFGERIELDKKFAESVYAALCNMQYKHVHTNHLYGCTWRYSGGLIAEIRNRGENYMDYYCSGNEGYITEIIANELLEAGWAIIPYDMESI